MKYHIYHHDDFDGTLCSALLLNFFRSKGNNVADFIPMNFSSTLKEKWTEYDFKSPFVIVDFIHHPKADWWFDHHVSSFIKPEWQEQFKNDRQHYFDSSYKSCYGMILNFLKREYGYEPLSVFLELEADADMIDSASFPSAKDALTIKSKAQEVAFLIDSFETEGPEGPKVQKEIIYALAEGNIDQILNQTENQDRLNKVKKDIEKSFELYRENCQTVGRVSLIDKNGLEIPYTSFVGRALFPELEYTVAIGGEGDDFHIQASRNHWLNKPSNINIGLMMKGFGGGGHKDVGGAEVASHEEALKVALSIVEYLNTHG